MKCARQPLRGKCGDIVVGHDLPLTNGDWIDGFIIWASASGNVKQWNRLVQVEHYSGVPVEVHLEDSLCQLLRDLDPITVVIVINISSPVGWTSSKTIVNKLAVFGITVIPIRLLVAAIWFRCRVD